MIRVLFAICVALLSASSLAAQWPTTTSPFLPPDHWSHHVLRRLHIAGLLPAGSDIARRSIPQEEMAELLAFAAEGDTARNAASYLHRFREEFPTPRFHGWSLMDASLLARYQRSENQVRAGIGYDTVWTGTRPIDDDSDVDALIRTAAGSRYLAVALAANPDGVEEMQLVLAVSPVGIWGGRREIGYAAPSSSGIVMNRPRLDAIGVFLTRPLRLPLLNNMRFELHLAQVDNVLALDGTQQDVEAWLWTGRGSFQPHGRLTIGVNRGVIFGGEGNLPVTGARLLRTLIGSSIRSGEYSFANEVFSFDVRYRMPTAGVPITLYLDWGADDVAGSWWEVPGIVVGAEFTPVRRDFSIGVERTEFKRTTPTNSHWYQNAWFRGSWADDGIIFGHPLAGHGVEWRLFGSGGSARGVTADIAAYRRHRRNNNLFAPERRGSSVGGVINADARLNAALRLLLAGEVEHGSASDWTAAKARAGVRVRF